MTAPTLLLSDLHLPNTPSPLREAFLRFLEGPARAAAGVYILGDLFEYWIGDAEGLRDYGSEAAALKRLTASGVPVWFMHGNRDFMVGKVFARAAGMRLLPDPAIVELAGVPTLLSHGDLYCTGDLAYQRWRRFSRNPVAQWVYRRMPESWRLRVAGTARAGKEINRRNKPESIMDVSADAVAQALATAGVTRLIHGHTHRPAEHAVLLPAGAAERIVLADWRPEPPPHLEYMVADEHGLHRRLLTSTESA